MSQWCDTLDATVPKCLSEGSQFVLFTKFGVWVKVMVVRILCRYLYQEKQSNAINQPLGARVINNMVSLISSNSNVLYCQLYVDNFLTSNHLMMELAEKSVRATGTIRQNRTERANKQLGQSKKLSKKERGTCDYCSDGKVYIAKWHNNSVVNIANNWENHKPVRKSKAEDKRRS